MDSPVPEETVPDPAPTREDGAEDTPQQPDDHGVAPTLVGISFEDTFRAEEFFTAAQGLAAKKAFTLKDAVLVGKTDEDRAHVHETIDPSPGRTAFTGAI